MTTITEIYDLHTEVGKTNVLRVHTPQDGSWMEHLKGFCMQYKRIKYNGCSVTLMPVARLPADPLQVSYEAGEPTIDPRDLMNPILHRHYHGERSILDEVGHSDVRANGGIGTWQTDGSITPPSEGYGMSMQKYVDINADNFASRYAECLMNRDYQKSGIMRPMKFITKPFVYNVTADRQIGDNIIDPTQVNMADHSALRGLSGFHLSSAPGNESGPTNDAIAVGYRAPYFTGDSSPTVSTRNYSFQTNRLVPMGFLDLQNFSGPKADSAAAGSVPVILESFRLPFIWMHEIIFPPAYKQEFYFRMAITHSFSFKDFRSCKGFNAIEAQNDVVANTITPAAVSSAGMKTAGSISVTDSMEIAKLADGVV